MPSGWVVNSFLDLVAAFFLEVLDPLAARGERHRLLLEVKLWSILLLRGLHRSKEVLSPVQVHSIACPVVLHEAVWREQAVQHVGEPRHREKGCKYDSGASGLFKSDSHPDIRSTEVAVRWLFA